ncbi:MAG: hypothetical protein ACK42D_02120 [Candidatus Paceibacteria bacterium]
MEKFNLAKISENTSVESFERDQEIESRAEFIEAKELLTLLKSFEGQTLIGSGELAKVEEPAKRLFDLQNTLTPKECHQLGLTPVNDNFPPIAEVV